MSQLFQKCDCKIIYSFKNKRALFRNFKRETPNQWPRLHTNQFEIESKRPPDLLSLTICINSSFLLQKKGKQSKMCVFLIIFYIPVLFMLVFIFYCAMDV